MSNQFQYSNVDFESLSFRVSVGEPWDFSGPSGENEIQGHVIRVVSEKCIVFRANSTLSFGDMHGDILILLPRYHSISFDEFRRGVVSVPVNGQLLRVALVGDEVEDILIRSSTLAISGALVLK